MIFHSIVPVFGYYCRMPEKHAFKELFLDALGEPPLSQRRSMVQGLQAQVKKECVCVCVCVCACVHM
jgi:hypothetical protein